ncbi:hypothetical protein HY838_01690 [Candidatus Azambacteria bacterium]|nr:hypothetical protein [Candidatus Azambacteria bacterium]
MKYLQVKAIKKINWLLLEVKIPRGIEKTPKAMEQIFAGLHGVLTSVKFLDKYLYGKVQKWFSLEIAGIGGGVYFFIRTPEEFRNLIEAQIHAQYPDAEISEVLDYTGNLSKEIPGKNYNIGGVEFVLDKANHYPIRTYQFFEEKEPERRIDPVASFLEILSKLRPNENIFIQYVIKPTGEKDWKEEGIAAVNKLIGKKTEAKKGWLGNFLEGLGEFTVNLLKAIAVYPEWGAAKKEEKAAAQSLSPGDKLIVEAIDNKMSKLAFKVCARFVYVAANDIFNPANISATIGAFKQFNTINLNAFKPNSKAGTSVDHPRLIPFIKNRREFLKKIDFIDRYVKRKFSKNKKDFIFNIEELATVYHYPILAVETPTLRRVEAKKAEPPASLPVE